MIFFIYSTLAFLLVYSFCLIIPFAHARWLNRKRRRLFDYSATAALAASFCCSIFFVIFCVRMKWPSSYFQSVGFFYGVDASEKVFYLDQAVILTALALNAIISLFIAARMSSNFIGAVSAALFIQLTVFLLNLLAGAFFYDFLAKKPPMVQERIMYLIELAASETLLGIFFLVDIFLLADMHVSQPSTHRRFDVGMAFTLVGLIPLFGFWFLGALSGVYYLIFLIFSLPVLLSLFAFLADNQGGERFNARHLLRMYYLPIQALIRAVGQIGRRNE